MNARPGSNQWWRYQIENLLEEGHVGRYPDRSIQRIYGWQPGMRRFTWRDVVSMAAQAPLGAPQAFLDLYELMIGSRWDALAGASAVGYEYFRSKRSRDEKFEGPQSKKIRAPDQPDQKDQVTEEPQTEMSKYVDGYSTYPSGGAVVQIKPINLKRFGRKPLRCAKELLEFDNYFEEYQSDQLVSVKDRQTFSTLFPEDVIRTTDGGGTVSKVAWNSTQIACFNSISQIEQFIAQTGFPYTNPFYDAASINGVTDPKSAGAKIVLDNQKLQLILKNVTSNAIGATGLVSHTPCFVSLYVVQAKENIFKYDPTAADNGLLPYISSGFKKEFSTDETLPLSLSQKLGVSWKHNQFMQDKFKVVASRKFIINSGQEAHLDIFLNTKQCLSTNYQLLSQLADVNGGVSDYNPLFIKKGEMRVMIDFHGGLAQTTGNIPVIEEVQLNVYGIKKYTMYRFNDNNSILERNNVKNVTPGVDYINEPDVAHLDGL